MEWVFMLQKVLAYVTICTSILAIIFSVFTLIQTQNAQKYMEKSNQENQELSEKMRKEDVARLEKQFSFKMDKEPLEIDVKLDETNINKLQLFDTKGKEIQQVDAPFIRIEKKTGWITKLYFIDSSFKDDYKCQLKTTHFRSLKSGQKCSIIA
ncbi:MAG: hypothetical protein LBV67_05660, partial [Streptococcaceae bacterium]|nr:hypothetical protein [Streptococcaceae bacterium]